MTEELRFRSILVPVDFSPASDRALEVAQTLAKGFGSAHLTLAHARFVPLEIEAVAVYGAQRVFENIAEKAEADLASVVEKLKAAGVEADYASEDGSPEEVILKMAHDRHSDLVIMGTHGRRGVSHLLLGSIAERVLRRAPCPVITVRPGD